MLTLKDLIKDFEVVHARTETNNLITYKKDSLRVITFTENISRGSNYKPISILEIEHKNPEMCKIAAYCIINGYTPYLFLPAREYIAWNKGKEVIAYIS